MFKNRDVIYVLVDGKPVLQSELLQKQNLPVEVKVDAEHITYIPDVDLVQTQPVEVKIEEIKESELERITVVEIPPVKVIKKKGGRPKKIKNIE